MTTNPPFEPSRPALERAGQLERDGRDVDGARQRRPTADRSASNDEDAGVPQDVVVWSHLRWSFVFQRPQHLMTRFARRGRVFFIEEPREGENTPRLDVQMTPEHVTVVTPRLPAEMMPSAPGAAHDPRVERTLRALLRVFFRVSCIEQPLHWFYTPMMLPLVEGLPRAGIAYDCMDELSAFQGASPVLRQREADLLASSQVVFTGGMSLYEAKQALHPNVHCAPSSVDVEHFAAARRHRADPPDQAHIPRARLGFYGVIDERMDLALLDGLCEARPDLHVVLIGPIAKIDPATLPKRKNLHHLGMKPYAELPAYLGGWDVAILPFARNESTRFISPTKTPEYMAGGKPVVSTPIRDVVRPYGHLGLVRIADDVGTFSAAVDAALHEDTRARLTAHDAFLADLSWELTWQRMFDAVAVALRLH